MIPIASIQETDLPVTTGKIVVAMSGGVDSTVTATLLKKQGLDVRGVFMSLAQPDLEKQITRVRNVAEHLKIPLHIVHLTTEFQQKVLEYFIHSYANGFTPNPCVVCNRKIKFGLLMHKVLKGQQDIMATGHYARTMRLSDGRVGLFKGKDASKDQSYFLCLLTQKKLSRIYFPLGSRTKKEVYTLADQFGVRDIHGQESQDVCFLQDKPVRDFLQDHLQTANTSGPVETTDGKLLGSHSGIHNFTIGQRRGLGLPDATPYYVVRLDAENNKVIVGKQQDLYRSRILVRDINWLSGSAPALPHQFEVKIRYRHNAANARLDKKDGNLIEVNFQDLQRAVTPGQFAVFYDGDEVVGGGEIIG